MTYHIPMCVFCGDREVQIVVNSAGSGFCSVKCQDACDAESAANEDGEPYGSYDLSDDGDALASAGWGTDEDYGYFGDDF